jgi:2-methylcitrate dehydratase PrpD
LHSRFRPEADGKKYTKRVDVPKGDPRDPMTQEEIVVRFGALGAVSSGRNAARRSVRR